jgi:diguanylate cyclase
MPKISAVLGPRTARRIGLPAPTWTLALLEAVAALALLASAAWPLSPGAPVHLDRVLAVLLMVESLLTLGFGRRIGMNLLLCQAFAGIAMTVLLIGAAKTAGGTLLSSAGYVWVAMWVSFFCSPRWLLAVLAAELAGVPIAALLNVSLVHALVAGISILVIATLLSAVLTYLLSSLRRVALFDQLTGLLNRHGVDQALYDVQQRRSISAPISMVAMDLDGLKVVNDRDGHLAGDRMLVAFARELSDAARSVDLPARLGGDEFVVILPGLSAAQATHWADSLHAGSSLDWSFGVSERRSDEPFETWLGRADQRMYVAKSANHGHRRHGNVTGLRWLREQRRLPPEAR